LSRIISPISLIVSEPSDDSCANDARGKKNNTDRVRNTSFKLK